VALDKIYERLLLIEKSMSITLNTARPSLSYADAENLSSTSITIEEIASAHSKARPHKAPALMAY
jgi:phage antirepressor YoqD-like protein